MIPVPLKTILPTLRPSGKVHGILRDKAIDGVMRVFTEIEVIVAGDYVTFKDSAGEEELVLERRQACEIATWILDMYKPVEGTVAVPYDLMK